MLRQDYKGMLLDSYKMKEEDVKTYFPLVLA
jgi:hypothetical protein